MQFDPSKYKITASAEFEVLDANGEIIYLDEEQTKPWTITVASPGTKKAMKAEHEKRQAVQGDIFGQMKGRKSSKNENSDNMLRADFLMKITEGTNADNLFYEGKTGMDALRAIYVDPLMSHVPAALEAFHNDRGNFSAESVKNLPSTSATSHG